MWLGASRPELPHSLRGVYELETKLGRELAIASFYVAWGDGLEHEFPTQVLESLRRGGYLPLVTWEPWLGAFERYRGQNPRSSLRKIASGEFDDYLRRFARDAVRYGHPFLLRPGHEATNAAYGWAPEYGNDARDYRDFWAHVQRVLREEGAKNALLVWTPHGLEEQAWFPGAEVVDWIGFDVFNYGGYSEQGTWLDFYTLTKLFYDRYRGLGPPLMITEVGTSSAGGNKADWIRDMFRSLAANDFPELRALVLFDQPADTTGAALPVEWSLSEDRHTFATLAGERGHLERFVRLP
jgi:hypothetical protein